MSTNAGPVYREAEARYRAAVTREEKMAALEEMLRVVPKHKGTEKLCADLKSRISKLRQEPSKKAGGGGASHRILHEGAGQVALVGPPNAGKSSLVAALTHARPEVAAYPMSTLQATPGMMPYEDVTIQLIDLPPVCHEYVEPWVYDIVRGADLVWFVLSIEHPLVGYEDSLELLRRKAIELVPWDRPDADDRRPGWSYRKAVLVVTGMDRPNARDDLEAFQELMEVPWVPVPVSGTAGTNLAELGRTTFQALDVIRVYSKEPGKPADRDRPFTLPRGATVADLAKAIHKDIADALKYARVWGPSAHDGQQVRGGHVLLEGDVVELHRV